MAYPSSLATIRRTSFLVALGTAILRGPCLDGRQAPGAVKQSSPVTPVIMLTGWGQRIADDGDLPSNVDWVLSKPPKLRELSAALAQFCGPGGRVGG